MTTATAARRPARPGSKPGIGASDPPTRDRIVAFGQRVRLHRNRLGMSQERLAERAGCDRQSVNRVENAAYSPSLPRILRLADALDVHPALLLGGRAPAGVSPDNETGTTTRGPTEPCRS